jgi:hypothetical protein
MFGIELRLKVNINFSSGFTQYHVNEMEGLSHHYRICEFGGFKCTQTQSVIDKTAHKWLVLITFIADVIHLYIKLAENYLISILEFVLYVQNLFAKYLIQLKKSSF